MPVTMEQVRAQLTRIEPDYMDAAKLGSGAMPFLKRLAAGDDIPLAARAVYLASLIGGDQAVQILLSAAGNPSPDIRIQAAGGARNLPKTKAAKILLKALGDSDVGVRNIALKSTRAMASLGAMPAAIRKKVTTLSKSDPEPFIRKFSATLLNPH
jgi:HEAT repeat protein